MIQLQHGGSNGRINRVRICEECHAQIHPHLAVPAETDETLYRQAQQRLAPRFDPTPRLVRRVNAEN